MKQTTNAFSGNLGSRAATLLALVSGIFLTLLLVHEFVFAVWAEKVPLDINNRIADQKGLAFRVLLPKEQAKRDRKWDFQTTLLENDYALGQPSSRGVVEEVGLGNLDMSQKSVWISTSDNEPLLETSRQYALRMHRTLPPSLLWLSGSVFTLSTIFLVAGRRWKYLIAAGAGAALVAGLLGVALCGDALHDQLYLRPVKTSLPPDPWYGTRNAPNADAQVWTDGALSYYFLGHPVNHLTYRPTISLFYASLLKVKWAISMIPPVFSIFFMLGAVALVLFSNRFMSVLSAFLFLTMGLLYKTYLRPLNSETLNVDFFATTLSIFGVLLIGNALYRLRDWRFAALAIAGFFALGITAAVRGPHLIGSAGFLALAFLFGPLRRRWIVTALCGIALIGPVFLDGQIRKKHELTNNVLISLHGISEFNGQPNQNWDDAVKDFLDKKPEAGTVVGNYFRYITSPDGRSRFLQYFNDAIRYEIHVFKQNTTFWILLGFSALALWLGWCHWAPIAKRAGSKTGWIRKLPLPTAAAVLGFAAALRSLTAPTATWAWFVGIILFTAFALWQRRWISFFLLAVYLGSLCLFIALANLGDHRVMVTFQWCSICGLLALLLEPLFRFQKQTRSQTRGLMGLAVALTLFIGFLYTGNSLLPGKFSQDAIAKVAEGKSLLKISEDPRIQRQYFWMPGHNGHFSNAEGAPGDFFPLKNFPDIRYRGSYYEPNIWPTK